MVMEYHRPRVFEPRDRIVSVYQPHIAVETGCILHVDRTGIGERGDTPREERIASSLGCHRAILPAADGVVRHGVAGKLANIERSSVQRPRWRGRQGYEVRPNAELHAPTRCGARYDPSVDWRAQGQRTTCVTQSVAGQTEGEAS